MTSSINEFAFPSDNFFLKYGFRKNRAVTLSPQDLEYNGLDVKISD